MTDRGSTQSDLSTSTTPSFSGPSTPSASSPRSSASTSTIISSRRPLRKQQRPSTAPGPEDAGRPPLLPSRTSATRIPLQLSSGVSRLTADEKKVHGYSISRGASPGDKSPRRLTRRNSGSSSGMRPSAAVNAEFAKALDNTVMDGAGIMADSAAPRITSAPNLPAVSSPQSVAPDAGPHSGPASTIFSEAASEEALEWNAFMRAYSLGQWDPYRTPLPPRSSTSLHSISPPHMIYSTSSPVQRTSTITKTSSSLFKASPPKLPNDWTEPDLSYAPGTQATPSRPSSSSVPTGAPSIATRRGLSADQLELSRVLGSLTVSSLNSSSPRRSEMENALDESGEHPLPTSTELAKTAAATVLWAGVGVQVAPLSLPSPIPSTHSRGVGAMTTLERVRTRTASSNNGRTRLDTIRASPLGSPNEGPAVEAFESPLVSSSSISKRRSREGSAGGFSVGPSVMTPFMTPFITAPSSPQQSEYNQDSPRSSFVTKSSDQHRQDYFSTSLPTAKNSRSGATSAPAHLVELNRSQYAYSSGGAGGGGLGTEGLMRTTRTPELRRLSVIETMLPSMETSTATSKEESPAGDGRLIGTTVPGMEIFMNPFTVCGAATGSIVIGSSYDNGAVSQGTPPATSLPTATVPKHDLQTESTQGSPAGISMGDMIATTSSETSFASLGYLAPPLPPDERGRMQALHRYSILYTAKDVNFDRLSHLAKLVFNVKMVIISLIDGQNQWHKSEVGLDVGELERRVSFCGHTILQRGDEPMVILDASNDWRFEKNPLVTGPPYIKFYAGAPLRTVEGYNLGAICIIDDVTRTDLSPRSRHTLKEFAAIVMRELELWRDQIQLRIRDRIQSSMEVFTRDCLEMDGPTAEGDKNLEFSMQRVHQRAATLIRDTLGVDGALVLDVSHFEALESLMENNESSRQSNRPVYYHANLYDVNDAPSTTGAPAGDDLTSSASVRSLGPGERAQEFGAIPQLPVLGSSEDLSYTNPQRSAHLNGDDHAKLSKFLGTHTDGKIYERLPSCFKKMMPANTHYAMMFNVDQRPYLLLCAYTLHGSSHFMEGYELQFLRAVGVIILSAVLKRRMALADTSKSLFIGNISHELRTPLHGIIASAELLRETSLANIQLSYLKTIENCANALKETVNHVLDFTKLSGKTSDGEQQHLPKMAKLDLKTLIDEVDDIQGWWVLSDAGGIRRILMNLIGNSAKFTTDGFIHVQLREKPNDLGVGKTIIELSVFDSGKGVSKDFLQNRMFQAFSQENPLQAGTGLGLAIVNAIGTSLGGKVEVWSAQGVGTEIRLVTEVDLVDAPEPSSLIVDPSRSITISMIGFGRDHKGVVLLSETMTSYLVDWWGFTISEDKDGTYGDILFVNEDVSVIEELTSAQEHDRPVILLSAARGNKHITAVTNTFEQLGGWCRTVFKPSGPVRLGKAFTTAVHKLDALRAGPASSSSRRFSSYHSTQDHLTNGNPYTKDDFDGSPATVSSKEPAQRLSKSNLPSSLNRRCSEVHHEPISRSPIIRHSSTSTTAPLMTETETGSRVSSITNQTDASPRLYSHPDKSESKVDVSEDGSVILRSVIGTTDSEHKPTVLLVDDNSLNRALLARWLNKRGYEFQQARDGQEAIDLFNAHPPGYFEIVNLLILMDLSMPNKNGFEASVEIRKIERTRRQGNVSEDLRGPQEAHAKLFALTGLASPEDKRKAFAAGVDGYLIKPVLFKTLDSVFQQLISA
ncbi:His Kinase A domain containing protein [Tulasnella sp. 331]|nr:His Kinase A domain containing protein [Tulasnella sp. 331]